MNNHSHNDKDEKKISPSHDKDGDRKDDIQKTPDDGVDGGVKEPGEPVPAVDDIKPPLQA